jgi:hypothetical protein
MKYKQGGYKVLSFIARMVICFVVFLGISALDFEQGGFFILAVCVGLAVLFWKLYQWLDQSAYGTE